MNVLSFFQSKIIKLLYESSCSLCRAYGRRKMPGDEPADQVIVFLSKLVFFLAHHYWPHFKKPRSFSEKIFKRMLNSRNKIWADITDKLSVRAYVQHRAGNEILIPMLWTGHDINHIPFEKLPSAFVIKMNHGSGYNIIIREKESYDIKEILSKMETWCAENYCTDKTMGIEWAYKNIKPQILIEKYISGKSKPAEDYKFYCFSGRAEYFVIIYDRFGHHRERHFTRDFVPLDFWNGVDLHRGPFIRPKNFEKMLEIADALSAGLDFIRVDLYNVEGKIYFGEMTVYPAGGLARFIPREWDFILGSKWQLAKD